MFELIFGLIEGLVALITAMVESLAGLFGASAGVAEGFSLFEGVLLLFTCLIEFIYWFVLWARELVISLLRWRRPNIVKRPVFWRPKKGEAKASEMNVLPQPLDLTEFERPYPPKGDPIQRAKYVAIIMVIVILIYLLAAG